MLQVGAGTGLIFLLRWFWWRINAWSEITAMIVSFAVAIYFQFLHASLGFEPLHTSHQLVTGVGITTADWLLVTWLTPPADRATLQRFYDKIRPFGRAWKKVVNTDSGGAEPGISAGILCWFLGVGAVYGAIFSTGYFIYGRMLPGLFLAVIAVACTAGIVRVFPRLGFQE